MSRTRAMPLLCSSPNPVFNRCVLRPRQLRAASFAATFAARPLPLLSRTMQLLLLPCVPALSKPAVLFLRAPLP